MYGRVRTGQNHNYHLKGATVTVNSSSPERARTAAGWRREATSVTVTKKMTRVRRLSPAGFSQLHSAMRAVRLSVMLSPSAGRCQSRVRTCRLDATAGRRGNRRLTDATSASRVRYGSFELVIVTWKLDCKVLVSRQATLAVSISEIAFRRLHHHQRMSAVRFESTWTCTRCVLVHSNLPLPSSPSLPPPLLLAFLLPLPRHMTSSSTSVSLSGDNGLLIGHRVSPLSYIRRPRAIGVSPIAD